MVPFEDGDQVDRADASNQVCEGAIGSALDNMPTTVRH